MEKNFFLPLLIIIIFCHFKLLSTKGYNLLLSRAYFTGGDGYQKILVFSPMLNSLTLDNNKKATNCMWNVI